MPHYALDGARADLTAPDEILALMAQDLNDLRRENYSVTMHELQSLGWSKRQLLNHFQPALEAAFRSYSETREPAFQAQAEPLLTFDAKMRRALAGHETRAAAPRPSDDANEVA